MAKVPFSKLKCKIDDSVKEVKLTDDITIEVKQYLPIQEKLQMVGRIIEYAHQEDFDYANPLKIKFYTELELIFTYTNLNFTDKQKEEITKIYDGLYSSGLVDKILINIPVNEYQIIQETVAKTIDSIYQYQNSILGILDTIKSDYNNLNLDIDHLNKTISDPDTLNFIKEMLSKIN